MAHWMIENISHDKCQCIQCQANIEVDPETELPMVSDHRASH